MYSKQEEKFHPLPLIDILINQTLRMQNYVGSQTWNDSIHFPTFCSFSSFLLFWKTNHGPPELHICKKHLGKHKIMTLFQQFNLNTFLFLWKAVQYIHLSLWKMEFIWQSIHSMIVCGGQNKQQNPSARKYNCLSCYITPTELKCRQPYPNKFNAISTYARTRTIQ